MKRIELMTGGYKLEADEGKDLITISDNGEEIDRAKSVFIPSGKTSINWQEDDEKPRIEEKPED